MDRNIFYWCTLELRTFELTPHNIKTLMHFWVGLRRSIIFRNIIITITLPFKLLIVFIYVFWCMSVVLQNYAQGTFSSWTNEPTIYLLELCFVLVIVCLQILFTWSIFTGLRVVWFFLLWKVYFDDTIRIVVG